MKHTHVTFCGWRGVYHVAATIGASMTIIASENRSLGGDELI